MITIWSPGCASATTFSMTASMEFSTMAGTGLAEVGSLQAAVQEAIHMINARSNITMSHTP